MPSAEIITIGTELLLGEVVDTNTQVVARALRRVGVDIYRTTTVGDNANRISRVILESLSRADVVITTGGLGPTVDDPTREAVAAALEVEMQWREDLWSHIQERLRELGREVTENNKRQAFVPRGATVLENERGTAPAFIVEQERRLLIALPGVPPEMEWLLEKQVIPWLRSRFSLEEIILSKSIKVVGIGESKVDDLIGDYEYSENPTVGLAAHKGSVEVRITSKANSETKALEMILEMEERLRERLSAWIPPERD
ncbi:MAG: molybdopterin-binding protein [Anaerolineales bacterium]